MSPVAVSIKHSGKSYQLDIQPSDSLDDFKNKIWQQTGVPPEKQKVVLKGSILKDPNLSALNICDVGWRAAARVSLLTTASQGQIFNVIGNAGPLPPPPSAKPIFLEDMDDVTLANATKTLAGLHNLGNTCYMNSTVQLLRQIPELTDGLNLMGVATVVPEQQRSGRTLVSSMKHLFENLGSTTQPFTPSIFLTALRDYAPQFGEMARSNVPGMGGGGYAQQDAEECWGAILAAMKQNIPGSSADKKWVEQWMQGSITTVTKSPEVPNEDAVTTSEPFLELKCNISVTTNFMVNGLAESLKQDIEKQSHTLGRPVIYHQESKISRLPSWLTVHMVRFYWRREIRKKAKIMRKVKFPFDLDLLEMLADDLKAKVKPVNEKLRSIDRERQDRANTRKKLMRRKDDEARERAIHRNASDSNADAAMEVDDILDGGDESELQKREKEELEKLVDASIREGDPGANYTGMYELWGIVTHKGASADGGHYVAWTRKSPSNPDEWYCFDDEKVSVVNKDKIASLDGGGEDHTAYILLYRSRTV
ncbi:cysteine proteinase [Atractiella rhizophila]|nr:cysteine proteinase [Atractiella rhizophila]